jgi:pimeloyl-ACP methyl ester carboxylesterase
LNSFQITTSISESQQSAIMSSTLLAYLSSGLGLVTNIFSQAQTPKDSPETQPLICDLKFTLLQVNEQSSHQTITLPDGRTLGFATFGAETGPIVFFLHGFGDSRLLGAVYHEPGKEQGLRIVAVDRPGIGLSTPQPNRKVLDHANDICLLAAHLQAETYSIMGVSGGGPYALACAYALPAEQLKAVSMVCGFGPFDLTMRNSKWTTYLIFSAFKLFPFLLRWSRAGTVKQIRTETADTFIANTKLQLDAWYMRFVGPAAKDAALLRDDRFLAFVYEAAREGCAHGVEGHMMEYEVMTASDLGFELEDIRADLPIGLWYGREDASADLRVGEALAKVLGGKARLFVREEAHLSLVFNCREEILRTMVDRM